MLALGLGVPMVRAAAGVSPLLENLVASWRLEEASGTRYDSHSNNLDLTDVNTVGSRVGKIGTAADFISANSEQLTHVDDPLLSVDGHQAFSGQLWLLNDEVASAPGVIGKWNGPTNQREWLLWRSGSSLRFEVSADGINPVAVAWGSALSTGIWYHVYFEHDPDANTIGISVNNGTMVTVAHSTGVHNGTSTFRVGAYNGAANYFDGGEDQILLWKQARTAAERTWLYNGGTGRTWAEILAYRG